MGGGDKIKIILKSGLEKSTNSSASSWLGGSGTGTPSTTHLSYIK